MPDPERQRTGRIGGLTSWSQTANRDARMAQVRGSSPADDSYHAKKLGFDIGRPLTDEQQKQVATAKKLYYARLRQASAATRKKQKTEWLRRLAAALEAKAAD
jgi:hypothetical protein